MAEDSTPDPPYEFSDLAKSFLERLRARIEGTGYDARLHVGEDTDWWEAVILSRPDIPQPREIWAYLEFEDGTPGDLEINVVSWGYDSHVNTFTLDYESENAYPFRVDNDFIIQDALKEIDALVRGELIGIAIFRTNGRWLCSMALPKGEKVSHLDLPEKVPFGTALRIVHYSWSDGREWVEERTLQMPPEWESSPTVQEFAGPTDEEWIRTRTELYRLASLFDGAPQGDSSPIGGLPSLDFYLAKDSVFWNARIAHFYDQGKLELLRWTSDPKVLEERLNALHLSHLVKEPTENLDEEFEVFAQALMQSWSQRLAQLFPDRQFEFRYDPRIYSNIPPGITYWQVR